MPERSIDSEHVGTDDRRPDAPFWHERNLGAIPDGPERARRLAGDAGADGRTPMSGPLDVAEDVRAVLRGEESAAVALLHEGEPIRCHACGAWIEPDEPAAVAVSLDGDRALAELAHRRCGPSRADLAGLVAAALAEPLGIAYVQAQHPSAGAVLIWERKLDVRLRGRADGDVALSVHVHRAVGFHPMRRDEPVGALEGWRLEPDGADLLLTRGGEPAERFHDAVSAAPSGWFDALRASGFSLLIVGAGLGLERPEGRRIQEALRSEHAVMGLVPLEET
jgi:hypothetical protein